MSIIHRLLLNFNSIKVRLELYPFFFLPWKSVFQFHKGTIRTWSGTANDDKLLVFQFHKGTIRTETNQLYVANFMYFNSIKVRLELYPTLK